MHRPDGTEPDSQMTLVDPEEYVDFKVLAQAKGFELDSHLLGFQAIWKARHSLQLH